MASFFPDFILSLPISENKYDRFSHLTLEKLNESTQFAICQATCFICTCDDLTLTDIKVNFCLFFLFFGSAILSYFRLNGFPL